MHRQAQKIGLLFPLPRKLVTSNWASQNCAGNSSFVAGIKVLSKIFEAGILTSVRLQPSSFPTLVWPALSACDPHSQEANVVGTPPV